MISHFCLHLTKGNALEYGVLPDQAQENTADANLYEHTESVYENTEHVYDPVTTQVPYEYKSDVAQTGMSAQNHILNIYISFDLKRDIGRAFCIILTYFTVNELSQFVEEMKIKYSKDSKPSVKRVKEVLTGSFIENS